MQFCKECSEPIYKGWHFKDLCKTCSRQVKNTKRRKTSYLRAGPYSINHAFFEPKEITKEQAFWYGLLTARCHLSINGNHYIIVISSLNNIMYIDFCKELESNYPLTKENTIKINNKKLFYNINYILNKGIDIIPKKFVRYFISGYLSTKGYTRITKSKSGGGNGYTNFSIESIDRAYIEYIENFLLQENISCKLTQRIRKDKIIFKLQVSKSVNLIKLSKLININNNYYKYNANIYNLITFANILDQEYQDRQKLQQLLISDYAYGASLSSLCSKFDLHHRTVKRLISITQNDLPNLLIQATETLSKFGDHYKCAKCNIYIRNDNKECMYCNKQYLISANKNKLVLQRDYSSQVRMGLLKFINGKNIVNYTIQNYTKWTFSELKNHLEILFSHPDNLTPDGKIWMNWGNWKVYSARKWDDNNPATWVWNIDHIKPQSDFNFKDKTDIEFKECWALSNLRPYSGKLNIKDGASKIRHHL